MSDPAKVFVIYKKGCVDSFCAAFIAWMSLGDRAVYLARSPEEAADLSDIDLRGSGTVYVLGAQISKKTAQRVIDEAEMLIWFDHQREAFDRWCPRHALLRLMQSETLAKGFMPVTCVIEFDQASSVAALAWRHFIGEQPLPEMFSLIEDHVLAGKGHPVADGRHVGLLAAIEQNAPWSFPQWQGWFRDFHAFNGGSSTDFRVFIEQGEAVLKMKRAMASGVVEACAKPCVIELDPEEAEEELKWPWSWISGRNYEDDHYAVSGLMANVSVPLAELAAQEMARKCGTFGLAWYVDKEDRVICRIKGCDGYDVRQIGLQFNPKFDVEDRFEVGADQISEWIDR